MKTVPRNMQNSHPLSSEGQYSLRGRRLNYNLMQRGLPQNYTDTPHTTNTFMQTAMNSALITGQPSTQNESSSTQRSVESFPLNTSVAAEYHATPIATAGSLATNLTSVSTVQTRTINPNLEENANSGTHIPLSTNKVNDSNPIIDGVRKKMYPSSNYTPGSCPPLFWMNRSGPSTENIFPNPFAQKSTHGLLLPNVSNNLNLNENLGSRQNPALSKNNQFFNQCQINELKNIISQVIGEQFKKCDTVNYGNRNRHFVNDNLSNQNFVQGDQGNLNGIQIENFQYSFSDICNLIPKFDNEGAVQPLDFLEHLESSINFRRVSFISVKIILSKCFSKSAKLWWEAFSGTFNSYDQFRNDFISYFWNNSRQRKIKSQLETDQYKEGLFVDHFNHWVSMSKHLQPPYTPAELIDVIAPHFPPTIASCLLGCNNFSEAVKRLKHADDYFNNKSSMFKGNESSHYQKQFFFNESKNKFHNNFKPNAYSKKISETNKNSKTISSLECDVDCDELGDQGNEVVPHI